VPVLSNDSLISVAHSKKEVILPKLALRASAPEHDWFAKWGDRVHLVNVETNGYEYQGTRYQSLSEIARLITDKRWSVQGITTSGKPPRH
jgi:hypothetical protein